jgi:DNA (cytosine-5)-methyltransferase 1
MYELGETGMSGTLRERKKVQKQSARACGSRKADIHLRRRDRARNFLASNFNDVRVVDLFCGAGGLTHGFKLEGFNIAAGIDVDEGCRYPFEYNNSAPFIRKDVTTLTGLEVSKLFHTGSIPVLVGCAPCQPFSIYNQKNSDPQWQLLREFSRIIADVRPLVVSMENVPSLVRFRRGLVFRQFVERLKGDGYEVWWEVVHVSDYGVPQTRSRLVLLASRLGPISLEKPRKKPAKNLTVRKAIGRLPALRPASPTLSIRCTVVAN